MQVKCSGGWEAAWEISLGDFPETKGLWIGQYEEILLFHSHMTACFTQCCSLNALHTFRDNGMQPTS